ncbi:MAG: hypothetical protein J6Y62_01860 [Clostridia bacterium]|nr:hypothetical protein [Clostridia bacterium]
METKIEAWLLKELVTWGLRGSLELFSGVRDGVPFSVWLKKNKLPLDLPGGTCVSSSFVSVEGGGKALRCFPVHYHMDKGEVSIERDRCEVVPAADKEALKKAVLAAAEADLQELAEIKRAMLALGYGFRRPFDFWRPVLGTSVLAFTLRHTACGASVVFPETREENEMLPLTGSMDFVSLALKYERERLPALFWREKWARLYSDMPEGLRKALAEETR